MLNLDEFTKTVFDDIRDGVPIIGTDYSSFDDANGLAGQFPVQSFSLPSFPISAVIPNTTFLAESPDLNEGHSWDTVAPRNFLRNYSERNPYYLQPTATPRTWTVDNASVLPPPIAHTKRRIEDDGPGWYTSKCGRLDGTTTVKRVPPSAYSYTAFSGFRAHDDTEGNALKQNNTTTRTSDCEEIFPAVDLVPVAVSSSAQGLWPVMTSTAALQRRPARTPYLTAEHSGQPFSFPIDTQASDAMPETSAQITSIPASEYGFDFSWPSIVQQSYTQDPSQALPWGSTQPAPLRSVRSHRDNMSFSVPGPWSFQGSLGSWPPSAVVDDAFPSISTPSMPSGYGQDSSFSPIVQQRPSQGQPKAQRLRRGKSRQHPNQALRTSAADSQPLPSPVTDSSFSIASQASSSSSSADTSDPAPQKKGKKKAQTPFLLAEDRCHLCREGFRRGSELHHHWTTNKHRLREREAENPGVIVTVDDLTPNCFCPSCGKGYTTPYVVKRHLKKCAGQAGSSQGGSQDGEGGSSQSTA